MRGLYLDCFSGISGDMLLGALVDLGVEPAHLRSQLKKLRVSGYTLSAARVNRSGLAGTKVDVALTAARQPERRLKDIARIVQASRLSSEVRRRAMSAFETLVEAEARVHRVSRDKVHLHEVGAVDAIVDIVGAMIGLERLGWPRVVCSPLHVGRGMVTMEHGTFPVPGPATAEILKGKPCYATHVEGELVTPTGAALAATLAADFGPLPPMRVRAIGYGAGTRDPPDRPNVVRVVLGSQTVAKAAGRPSVGEDPAVRDLVVMEANLDDLTPELVADAVQALLSAGSLDVWTTPTQMKKGRPGILLSVLCEPDAQDRLRSVFFETTSTFGVRSYRVERAELARRTVSVDLPDGSVRVKVGLLGGRVVSATPEHDDVAAVAARAGRPVRHVYEEATAAARTAWLAATER